MRLIELRSNKKSFHTVRFNPYGISIIAAVKKTDDQRKTYNSVGKSLIIALIHFCLGSKANKSFQDTMGEWVFELDFQIGEDLYTSVRSVANQKTIHLNNEELSIKEFNSTMAKLAFRKVEEYKFISFRSLISRFIRFGENGYVSNDTYIKKENDITKQMNNSFLLGLDVNLILRKVAIKEKEINIQELKKQFKNPEFMSLFGTDENKDIDIQIVELETKIENYKTSLRNFVIAEDYYSIKKDADKLSYDLKAKKNKATKIQNVISNLDRSLEVKPDISVQKLVQLYEEANVQLGDMVIRKLNELQLFNSQLLDNRASKLFEEKRDFEKQLSELQREIAELGREEDEKLRYLNTAGALEDYTALNLALADVEKKLYSYAQYKKLTSDYKISSEENKREFMNENIITDKYLDTANDVIKNNIILFKSFVSKFYSDKNSGISIENNTGKNSIRFNIKTKIQDDAGNAVNEVKIFCYDWTILKGQHNHRIDFLFHDSKITGDMDPRQIKTMFDIAEHECNENRLQYIISLNQNVIDNLQLDMGEERHKRVILDNIILTLNDKSPEDKLLGVQIDLDYDR